MAPTVGRRLVLGAAAALAAPPVARAQRARTLTISSILGPQSPQARVWVRMQEEVDRILGPKRIRFNVVAGGVMGGERQEAEGMRVGSIQGSLSTLADLTAWVADGAVFDMPFIFRDEAHIAKVMQGPIGQRLFEQYRQQGFRAVGHISYGSRNLLAKQAITRPEEARGRRMRVIPAPLHIELWRSPGANPTQTAITETYNALQTGVVDMMDFTKSGYAQLKLYEVAPHFAVTNHIWALGVMYFGEQFWQSITAPERDALMQAGAVSCPHFIEMANADHDRALAEARAAGATIVEPDPAPWRAAMEPFWQSFGPRFGGIERIMQIVDAA
jgi:TRAP-type C4-dicarboxylate transport system substrate-binding protein